MTDLSSYTIADSVAKLPDRGVSIRWWREWEPYLLAVLVLAIYGSRMTALPLRGEEPRRGRIAVEMIDSGDWIVPRQQGLPFRSRPPLQNWLIGLAGLARGEVDAAAIRLPSILATLLTTWLVYGYARIWLSRGGASVAGLSYATMGQVLELGGLGETEALFTLFVSGSLLIWHAGYHRRRGWGWIAGYFLVGLGMLAKGPQAPVYFVCTVGVYLLLTRQARRALSPWHVAGIILFLAVWNAWQVPYSHAEGWSGLKAIYAGDVAMRWADTRWLKIAGHLVTYPCEVLICLLPWSILLVAYGRRDFRRELGPAREMVAFLVVALAVTFPTCWLVPGARGRYYMPLYPCFAPLIGLAAERCMQAQPLSAMWNVARLFARGTSLLMLQAAVVVVGISFSARHLSSAQPPWFAIVFAVAAVGLAMIAWGRWSGAARRDGTAATTPACDARQSLRSTWALAIFLGLFYTGVVVNSVIKTSEVPPAEAIARLRQKLPPGTRLVSFNWVDPLFAYSWRDTIRQDPWPRDARDVAADVVYFCYGNDSPMAGPINFAFDKLAEISCDRVHSDKPHRLVVVGKIRR